jgi:hypothetical protein
LPTRISGGSAGQTPAVLRTTVSRLRSTSLRCGIRSLSDTEIQEDLEADADIASSNRNKPWLFAEATRCESPVSDFSCDGWCREPGHVHADDDVKADVVSLAASKDSQFSWEDEKGISMTAVRFSSAPRGPNLYLATGADRDSQGRSPPLVQGSAHEDQVRVQRRVSVPILTSSCDAATQYMTLPSPAIIEPRRTRRSAKDTSMSWRRK